MCNYMVSDRALSSSFSGTLWRGLSVRHQGEFHALPHGIDAVGTNADAVAEVPFEGTWFCATPTAARALRSLPAFAAAERHDSVIPLAIDATCVRCFFQRADGQQSFNKNF